MHLTLKFLGEVSEKQLEAIKERLRKIQFKKFMAKISNGGVFDEDFIRIIWIKVENCEKIQKKVDNALSDLFEKEKRFMSHLTIARVKSYNDKKKIIEEIRKIKLNEEFIVDKIEIMKSNTSGKGPKYEILEEYDLSNLEI